MFEEAPTAASTSTWVGSLFQLDSAREVLPFRCSTLDYVVLFLSPHAECDDDETFMAQLLDTLCIQGFLPARGARLIKLCRADAQDDPFKPERWPLQAASPIFRFIDAVAAAAKAYVSASPHVHQYLLLPANAKLSRLYTRLYRRVTSELGISVRSALPSTGALHVYERTSRP